MRTYCTLILTLVFLLLACSAAAEDIPRRSGDYEYVISNGEAILTAYHGEYLPRFRPESLDGVPVAPAYLEVPGALYEHLNKTWDIYKYAKVAEDEVWITGYTGFQRIARIPESIYGMKVTGIADYAFWLSGFERDPFAEVVYVPGTVRTIGRLAFGCSEIGYILLEEGLEEIGDLAFEGHTQSTLYIPSTVWKMGENPLSNSELMGSYSGYPWLMSNEFFETDGDTLYDLRDRRIISCCDYNPEYFLFPDDIRSIGARAFYCTPELKELTLPDSVRVIEPYAFAHCYNLETINLPEGLTEIGECAFDSTAIKEISIPSSVTVLGEYALPDDAVILCDRGSQAEAYAMKHGNPVRIR